MSLNKINSTLYIVATPIGNLEDITFRAIRVLREADLILCEDTRVTKKLLAKYEISARVESYHAHTKITKAERFLNMLAEGKNIALVSDAGTPAISDPGVLLVKMARARFGHDAQIVPIPGPSALTTAISAAGIPAAQFTFLGFLPHKKGRETAFRRIADSSDPIIFYESPHRIMKTLRALAKSLPHNRKICIARELTKIHESFVSGSAEEVEKHFLAHPDQVRGECVVIVEGK
ncbi:MAG: 16S rRNA (cytidine(1402)-2'-O)-methyltransferase [Patescibacteria group bacterium]